MLTRPDAPAGAWSPPGRLAGRRTGARVRHRGPSAAVALRSRRPRPVDGDRPGVCARRRLRGPRPGGRPRHPEHGWVNLHFSLLPAWRGAAPVQHASGAATTSPGPAPSRWRRGSTRARSTARSPSRSGPTTRRGACCRAAWPTIGVGSPAWPPSTRSSPGTRMLWRRWGSRRSHPSSPSTTPASGGTPPRRPSIVRCAPAPLRPGAWSSCRGDRVRIAPVAGGRRRTRTRAGPIGRAQERRAGRHRHRARPTRAGASRPASARCPQPTGRAVPG